VQKWKVVVKVGNKMDAAAKWVQNLKWTCVKMESGGQGG